MAKTNIEMGGKNKEDRGWNSRGVCEHRGGGMRGNDSEGPVSTSIFGIRSV
jgi:hypothetical protein